MNNKDFYDQKSTAWSKQRLTPEQYQLLITGGINDWGGVSPLTIDFINPEAPWPQLRTLAQVSAEMITSRLSRREWLRLI